MKKTADRAFVLGVVLLTVVTAANLACLVPVSKNPPAALSLADVKITNITETSATVSWSTSRPATGWLEAGTDTTYGSGTQKGTQISSVHSVRLEGLKPLTLYHVKACSSDAEGNTASSGDMIFTTLTTAGSVTINKGNTTTGYNKNLAGAFVVAWSPDGRKVAYIKYHGQGTLHRQDIFTSNSDGSNEQRLTDREQEEYTALAWSPDGKQIAYVGTGQDYAYMQLWVMDYDGNNLKHLVGGPSVDSIGGPLVWSADGKRITYGYSRYGNPGFGFNRFNEFEPNYHTGQPDYSQNYERVTINIDGN